MGQLERTAGGGLTGATIPIGQGFQSCEILIAKQGLHLQLDPVAFGVLGGAYGWPGVRGTDGARQRDQCDGEAEHE
ncbi:hypothetical protein D3C72_1881420 [compost metagenome]